MFTGKRLHSLGCFLRGNKGYTVAVKLLFFEDGVSCDISRFFGFTKVDLIAFQTLKTMFSTFFI